MVLKKNVIKKLIKIFSDEVIFCCLTFKIYNFLQLIGKCDFTFTVVLFYFSRGRDTSK